MCPATGKTLRNSQIYAAGTAGNKYVSAIKARAWSINSFGHDSRLNNYPIELTPQDLNPSCGVNPAVRKYYTLTSVGDHGTVTI
jgi:hypothetical protein